MTELASRVEGLIRSGARESSTLDYKRDVYATTEGGRKEFAKDLTAFANKDGGILLVGVREENGAPAEVVGVPAAEVDSAILWLESVARSGVNPHLPSLVINQVSIENKALIAVSVPRGMDPPYEVASAGGRFFVRDERSVRTMSREEIKFAVSRSTTLMDRVDQFVDERMRAFTEAMRREQTLGSILIVTPLFDETLSFRYDLPTVASLVPNLKSLDGGMISSGKPRLDGLLFEFDKLEGQAAGSARIFRHGGIEIIDGYMFGRLPDGRMTPGLTLMNGLIKAVRDNVALARKITGAESFAIDFRIQSEPGKQIAFYNNQQPPISDRADLMFDRLIASQQDLDVRESANVVRPLLDQIWQAFGQMNCRYFTDAGKYQPPN